VQDAKHKKSENNSVGATSRQLTEQYEVSKRKTLYYFAAASQSLVDVLANEDNALVVKAQNISRIIVKEGNQPSTDRARTSHIPQ